MKKLTLLLIGMTAAAVTSSPAEDLALEGFQPPLRHTWDQPLSGVEKAQVELGKLLYFEKRLSRDNTISCNSCHDLKRFGVDGRDFSLGFENHPVGRNSPTVFNAFGHIAQFWDGRAPTVEEQAKGPILAAGEMAMPSPDAVVKKLKGIPAYKPLFEAAFPADKDPINYDNVGTAIGRFERLLATPSRWDLFLAGADEALSPLEKEGVKKFSALGCTTCHTGTLIGGDRYMKLGLVKPWPNQKDQGRFAITGDEADKMVFKVPSLRNIEKTGPYFHDASETTLAGAIRKMARHQLGAELSADDVSALEAFMKTLTADIPAELAATPEMPGKAKKVSFD